MGIFRERRTSLPTMAIKDNSETTKDKKEVLSTELDSEYVNKMSTASGIKITSTFECSKSHGLDLSQAHAHVKDSESKLSCIVRLEPDNRDESLYCIRMVTNLEFLPLKRSCSYRSFSSWYFLQNFLKKNIPGIKIEDLPPRHLLWIKTEKHKLEELGYFLKSIISNQKLLSNKVIQLFLQSNVSQEILQENSDKVRDDDVVRTKCINLNFSPVPASNVENVLTLNNTSNQYTYHGSSTVETHKTSVQNLFKRRQSVVHSQLQSLVEDSDIVDEKSVKHRVKNVIY